MNPGDKVVCPACAAESFIKLKPRLDGWTKIGDSLVCGLCGHELCDYEPIISAIAPTQPNSKTSALVDLLGGIKVEKPVIEVADDERRFCRDCQHFIVHPFMSRCTLHDKQVNPMDDCAEFNRKLKK